MKARCGLRAIEVRLSPPRSGESVRAKIFSEPSHYSNNFVESSALGERLSRFGACRRQRSSPCVYSHFSHSRGLSRAQWHDRCPMPGVTPQKIKTQRVSAVAVATHCPYCALQCGMRVTRGAGVISGDEEFPVNNGVLCVKG